MAAERSLSTRFVSRERKRVAISSNQSRRGCLNDGLTLSPPPPKDGYCNYSVIIQGAVPHAKAQCLICAFRIETELAGPACPQRAAGNQWCSIGEEMRGGKKKKRNTFLSHVHSQTHSFTKLCTSPEHRTGWVCRDWPSMFFFVASVGFAGAYGGGF